jgi:ActR/RegA family two-component response regulator
MGLSAFVLQGAETGSAACEPTPTAPDRRAVLLADAGACAGDLAHAISGRGFAVFHATTASAALRLAASLRPSLCLAEWQLDGYQGPRLIGELRAASPTTRVIVTTVFGSIAAARLAFRGGASGYLTKPVSAQDVFALLAQPPSDCDDDAEVRSGHWLTLDAARREYIREVLARCGTVAETARVLGIDRRSLRRMLARFELLPRRSR